MFLAARSHQRQQHAASHHAGHLPGSIGAHRVHEQKVLEVLFLCNALHDARRHREGADASRTDHRIDLAAADPVEHFGEQYAGCRIDAESDDAEDQDGQRGGWRRVAGADGSGRLKTFSALL